MNSRHLLASPALWLVSAGIAVASVFGCSSGQSQGPTTSAGCTAGSTVSCTCANGQTGTELCGAAPSACSCGAVSNPDAGAHESDSGAPGQGQGDGGHLNDGSTPTSLYGTCAVQGGFGWPCTQANANDPTSCTDPEYPFCFGGGQGFWCTKKCTAGGGECAQGVESSGCTPTSCNARGYCK